MISDFKKIDGYNREKSFPIYHINSYFDNSSTIATNIKTPTAFKNSLPESLSHTFIEGLFPFGCSSIQLHPLSSAILSPPLAMRSSTVHGRKAKLNQKVYTFKNPSNYYDGLMKILLIGVSSLSFLTIISFLQKRLTDEMLLYNIKLTNNMSTNTLRNHEWGESLWYKWSNSS